MLSLIRQYRVIAAACVWLVAVQPLLVVWFRIPREEVDPRWWVTVVLVAFYLYGCASVWFFSLRGLPDEAVGRSGSAAQAEASLVMVLVVISAAPMPLGIAGIYLGAAPWAIWLTPVFIAANLAACVVRLRRESP